MWVRVSTKVTHSFSSLWQFCGTDMGQSSQSVAVLPPFSPWPTAKGPSEEVEEEEEEGMGGKVIAHI